MFEGVCIFYEIALSVRSGAYSIDMMYDTIAKVVAIWSYYHPELANESLHLDV